MHIPTILTIWLKELKDTTRDKRTLYAMVFLPVIIMPALLIGITKFSQYQQQQSQDKTVVIAVDQAQINNPIVQAISHQDKVSLSTSYANVTDAVKQEKVDAAIKLPPDAATRLQNHQPVAVTFIHKSVRDYTSQAQLRIAAAIAAFNAQLIESRLQALHQNPTILSGATLQATDVSTTQEKSGFGLSFILPLFIVMWAITGGQYTAIDASAGEKERKTLEALLLTPASRTDIVVGKFLAVASVSLVSILLSLASLYVSFKYLIHNLSGIAGTTGSAFSQLNLSDSLTPQALGLMLLTSIMLSLLFAAILLTVGIFAKSYREAQSYLSPVYLLTILPVSAINAAPGIHIPDWLYLIPPLNAVQMFKELLQGAYNPLHIGLTLASLLVTSIIAIIISVRIFQQERVLFKQ